MEFEIEQIVEIKEQTYVLAKRITSGNVVLSDKAKLDGVPIHKWTDIPRGINEHGDQWLDLYAFVLRDNKDSSKFNLGQKVELTP